MMKLPQKKYDLQPNHWFGNAAPLWDLRHKIESLFDHSFQDIFSPKRWSGDWLNHDFLNPKTDIVERDDAFELNIEMPGVSEDHINVTIANGVLTVEAEKKHEEEEQKKQYHRSERTYGMFRRSFHLLDNMDADAVEATYRNGILKITVPIIKSQADVKKVALKS